MESNLKFGSNSILVWGETEEKDEQNEPNCNTSTLFVSVFWAPPGNAQGYVWLKDQVQSGIMESNGVLGTEPLASLV